MTRASALLLCLFLVASVAALSSATSFSVATKLGVDASPADTLELDPPGWKFTACSNPVGWTRKPRVVSPPSHETLRGVALPRSLFWGNVSGVNYLTPVRQQHLPQYCGSCWAFATLSSLSDRVKIARNAAYPEVILSPQVIINCNGGGSCNGGDPHGVYEYLAAQGLPDETCQAYVAANGVCEPMGVCETCEPGVGCAAVSAYDTYGLTEYGDVTGSFLDSVSNADAIKAELAARGPVACDISVTDKFEKYRGGIFSQQRLFSLPNHIIALVGYGVTDNGTEFWIARNSWGTAWGEQGFARILMHRDNLGIERGCTFGVPVLNPLKPLAAKISFTGSAAVASKPAVMQGGACLKRRPGPRTSFVRTPQPHTYLKSLPASYDIRNVSGVNFATPTRNQHVPVYCGSCWAHSTASALSDRFALARGNVFPEIFLAPQVLVDCVTENSHGCEGGDPNAAFEFIMKSGITDESCSPYQATDGKCTPQSLCGDCSPNPLRGCYPVEPSTLFRVTEHGQAYGEEQMMAEIAARGPIVCGMCVTEAFERYSGGTFVDNSGCRTEMHAISIAGYGTDAEGRKTWIGRNSWGTPWGEAGWFTLERGADALGIESIGCDWGVVELPSNLITPS